jgi:ABC-2 type transport system ATP-binding protein
MSIRVQHLTKKYGEQKAVDDISFEIGENEIVGFLGPNGAGKSTTMKIATGYIPPTDGLVDVGGFNVVTSPMKVKRITGYLPEHNPLYLDMYVHEFLSFAGKVYGLSGKQLSERVFRMVEKCGLTHEQNKKIHALSKGYRQRVGLAQALIHDPKVLILDEPTSGLDPNQLIEIRKLIKDVSINKTVIFSTHIMQEVEALCERVIVINKGRIVADDRLANLMGSAQRHSVVAQFDREVPQPILELLSSDAEIIAIGNNTYKFAPLIEVDLRARIFRLAADNNLSLISLKQEERSLESVFQELTR